MMEIDILDVFNKKNIIDIRDSKSYNMGRIPNARLIDKRLLLSNPDMYLNKDETYYIYCNRGIQSKNICKLLLNMGYKIKSIKGGYEAYLKLKNN